MSVKNPLKSIVETKFKVHHPLLDCKLQAAPSPLLTLPLRDLHLNHWVDANLKRLLVPTHAEAAYSY